MRASVDTAPDSARDAVTTTTRVRARYAKTGKIRFISAIDLGRIWERSLRLADLPIAYSEGFSPHPKVSFPDALPLGYASTGEYAELTFAAPIALDPAMAALNTAFPAGLTVLAAVSVPDGAPRLSRWLQASCWDMAYPPAAPAATLRRAVDALRSADAAPVERERKGKAVEIDLRPAIHEISCHPSEDGVRVRVVLHHVEPPVRPSEVHLALESQPSEPPIPEAGLAEPTLITRVAQGKPADGGLVEAITGEHIPVDPDAPLS